ncbi:MAG: hypothetical protein ACYDH1_14580 [Anaerolineaceae bacterium]
MNIRKSLSIFLVLSLLMAVMVNSASSSDFSADEKSESSDIPWKTSTVMEVLSDTEFASVVLIDGSPGITYFKDDEIWICKANGSVASPCYHTNSVSLSFDQSTVSEAGIYDYPDTFTAKWAYQPNLTDSVYLYWVELMKNNLSFVDSGDIHLFDLDTGESVKGPIAMALDESGKPHVAVILHHNDYDRLIYIYWTGISNASCGFSSVYQCDRIQVVPSDTGIYRTPNIVLASDGTPRITYIQDISTSYMIKFAYPRTGDAYHPNCGPGNNTWRCINLMYGLNDNSKMDLAMGTTQPHVAWTYPSAMGDHSVIGGYARRVGFLGGDCVEDYVMNPFTRLVELVHTWKCDPDFTHNSLSTPGTSAYISLDVTTLNEPVVAHQVCDASYCELHVRYIDPNMDFSADEDVVVESGPASFGRRVSLILNANNLGFMGYYDDRDYDTFLKTAQQYAHVFLPALIR